jgi:hypothetical protein
MINALGNALQGLMRAEERLGKTSEKIASGDVSVENLVDAKIEARDVKTQAKALSIISKVEDEVLDILA